MKDEKKNSKVSKIKSNNKFLKFIIIVVVLIIIVSIIGYLFFNKFNKTKYTQLAKKQNKYTDFANNWNNIVLKIEVKNRKEFLLNTSNDEEIIKKLNNIFNAINISFSKEAKKEFNIMEKDSKNKQFFIPIIEYINQLEKYKNNKNNKVFDSSMSEDEIYSKIKNITGRDLDYDTLKNIIGLSSFCNFFYLNMKKLYNDGMTKNFFNCKDVILILRKTGKYQHLLSEIKFD